MAQISTRKIKESVWTGLDSWFLEFIERANNRKMVKDLVEGLLTPTERTMLVKRMMVGVLVNSDWGAYEIADALKMSVATVYKLQRITDVNPRYRMLLKKRFPKKIRFEEKYKKDGDMGNLIEDILLGKRERWRLHR